ncbi:stress response protein NhaX [bacterium BMS3Abin07]|nr:stress response protein NhaX [bacterium BMS3Abin07]GBE32718.1 stress response protein NhaX [bacterium BMS3Bbin05]HDL21284.1 universal stress protein [Nitrospirota bacterium]HDO21985.1 universal stress protein [Nitrospirota bacterium]
MKKVLLAVDDTKGSLKAAESMVQLFPCIKPETVVLLFVKKPEGLSLMDDALMSVGEMETLKESLENTEYQEQLDRKAQKIIDYFRNYLEENGITGIRPVVKQGHPADEILATASEEEVDIIIIGSRGKRLHNLFMGSVSREVSNRAEVPVLIAK